MKFFKNKFLISVFILSATIYLLSAPTAQAGDALDILGILTGGLTTIAVSTVSVVSGVLSGDISALLGFLVLGDPTALILCAEGVICPNGQTSGLVLAPVSSDLGCAYQIPMTFYNPRMNVSYGINTFQYLETGSCAYSGGDEGCRLFDVGASPRYRDSSCTDLVSDSYSLEAKFANVAGVGCVGITPSSAAYVINPNFNETNRQVAIYRFTLPSDSNETTLNNWFIYQVPASVSNGWNDYPASDPFNPDVILENYHYASDSSPLITASYADLCDGNVCQFTDATVPENSYVAYVAKIMGNYAYLSPDFNPPIIKADKFLNADNASYAQFPLFNNTLGNAIVGPFKTNPCPASPSCGDGVCNGSENSETCPVDCPPVPPVPPVPPTPPSAPTACHCSRCSTVYDRQWVEFDSTDSTCATVVPDSNSVTKSLNCTCRAGNTSWYNSNYSGVCR